MPDQQSERFSADVRFVHSAARKQCGFLINDRVLWVDEHAGKFLWKHGPRAMGLEVLGQLATHGAVARDVNETSGNSRTDAFNRHLLSGDMDGSFSQQEVVIVGCGGLGSNLAIQLASLGMTHFALCDKDCIEASNLNRLLWAGGRDVGSPKVSVLRNYLEKRFDSRVRIMAETATTASIDNALRQSKLPQLVVLSVDGSRAARELAMAMHGRPGIRYTMTGYVGTRCIAGPLVNCWDDPCPFCDVADEIEILSQGCHVAPSASPNNLFISSFLACQILLAARRGACALDRSRWVADLRSGDSTTSTVIKNPKCTTCSKANNAIS